MSAPPAVIAAVDTPDSSGAAVILAAEEAVRHGLPLRLLHVLQPPVTTGLGPYGVNVDDWVPACRALLEELAAQQRRIHPDLDVTTSVIIGSPASTLIEATRSAPLVVVGCRGRGGFAELLLGSVSAQLAAHAHGPVIVVRPADNHPRPRLPVTVGVDGSPTSAAAAGFAFAEAAARGVTLTAVHVWWTPSRDGLDATEPWHYDLVEMEEDAARLLAESIVGWREHHPDVTVEPRLIHSPNPEAALVDASTQAGLIVAGSRGRGGFSGLLLGSVSQALVHHARCPVGVIHPADDPPGHG